MMITKISPRTKTENTMEVAVTDDQILAWQSGMFIQTAMPHLTPDEREFLMTGYTPADWASMFPEEEV